MRSLHSVEARWASLAVSSAYVASSSRMKPERSGASSLCASKPQEMMMRSGPKLLIAGSTCASNCCTYCSMDVPRASGTLTSRGSSCSVVAVPG